MNKIHLCAMLVAIAVVGDVSAEEENLVASGNNAYSEAHFQTAIDRYEAAIHGGNWHANVFYNLGNAYYRLGNFGKAILNYERALALDPRQPEADANLRLARDEARALELRRDWIERYASMATVRQYSVAAAVGFWLALFVAVHLVLSRRRSLGRIALMVIGVLVCGASAFAIFTLENGTRGNALAVVTAKETEARLATADNAKSILLLPGGSEIKILSERGDWIYAALPNEQRGWIPTSSAERVRP